MKYLAALLALSLCSSASSLPRLSIQPAQPEPAAAAVASYTFMISGTATSNALGFQQICMTVPAGLVCDVNHDCNVNLFWCTKTMDCVPGETAEEAAARIAMFVNDPVGGGSCAGNPGFTAVVTGSTVRVDGPAGVDFDLSLASGEFACGGGQSYLLSGGCTISNVCNGVPCDEQQTHTSGFRFAVGGGKDVLWNNGSTDASNAYSNSIDACYPVGVERRLLDDFQVDPPGWKITCFEWDHLWDLGGGAGFGTGATFDILNDNGGDPGALVQSLNITSYSDEVTGNIFFSRAEVISTISFDALDLDPGRYWFEGAICGNDNNFWLVDSSSILLSECWVDYSDSPPQKPGSAQFGEPADLAWRLSGTERVDDRIKTYCNPGDGHPKNTATLEVSGNVLSQGPIQICMTGGPSGQFGFLLIGSADGIVQQPPGSEGDLCVAGGFIARYDKDIGLTDGTGSLCTDIENSASGGPNYGIPNTGGTGSIQPGDTWYFQYWHRQPAGLPASFSEAACVTFKQ